MHFIYLLFVLASSFLFFFQANTNLVYAQTENFAVDINSVYEFHLNQKANVSHQIFIENLNQNITSKAYSLKLKGIHLENVKAFEAEEELAITVFEKDKTNEIMIYFNEVVAGVGNKREIKLTYQSDSYLSNVGDVWDLYIPHLQGSPTTRNANVTLIVPTEIAKEAYITPHTFDKTVGAKNTVFTFTKNSVLGKSIRAIYGTSQVYQVDLSFVLENKSIFTKQKTIALPPDTNRQKVMLASISDTPVDAYVNDDGNWIYVFDVPSMSTKKITANLFIQVFSESVRSENLVLPPANILANLTETSFWQADDVEIQKLAKELKTPEKIYRYVVDTLDYNKNEATINRTRKGGKGALADPKNSICTEFTDLFITLSRAAGIPAREIIGYGYSDYREKEPLSLVTDVLHSWPEYWDESEQKWVPVDPTWEDTSGQDYFNDFDTRHITFVIHGKEDTSPEPPGTYTTNTDPQLSKQVFVSLAKPVSVSDSELEITHSGKYTLPILFKKQYEILVQNKSIEAVYDQQLYISGGTTKSIVINAIVPMANYSYLHEVNYSFLGLNHPSTSKVLLGKSEISIDHSAWDVILPFIVFLFILFFCAAILGFLIYFFPKKKLSEPF